MRIDWVPYSASALVAGATALSVGAILQPRTQQLSDILDVADGQRGIWMAVSFFYFFASAALVLGMPSVLTLFDRRGTRTGIVAIGVFTIGCVGIAGFAMLLSFTRALVLEDAVTAAGIDAAVTDTAFAVLLYSWVATFYLGEVLLAIAVLRSRTTPRWIPLLLLAHAALYPVADLLPETLRSMSALLITVSLAGMGIAANNRSAALT